MTQEQKKLFSSFWNPRVGQILYERPALTHNYDISYTDEVSRDQNQFPRLSYLYQELLFSLNHYSIYKKMALDVNIHACLCVALKGQKNAKT